MSQTTKLTRVKARIKALAEKTGSNGCIEAEAMAAADMVGRLLERYALSMEEIDLREERCVRLKVPLGGKQRRPINGCVTAIARFCDLQLWTMNRWDEIRRTIGIVQMNINRAAAQRALAGPCINAHHSIDSIIGSPRRSGQIMTP